MKWKCAIAGAAMAMVFAPSMAQADSSVGSVENARAKERQGQYLTPEERDQLRRYGSNADYGRRYGYGGYGYSDGYYDDGDYGGDYDYGPGVHVYVGPGY